MSWTEASVHQLVMEYTSTVISDKTGYIKSSPVILNLDPKHKPMQPPYRPIPLQYGDEVSSRSGKTFLRYLVR